MTHSNSKKQANKNKNTLDPVGNSLRLSAFYSHPCTVMHNSSSQEIGLKSFFRVGGALVADHERTADDG